MKLFALIPVAALALAAGAAGAPAPAKVRPAAGPIESLAMDGSRIAYDVRGDLGPGVGRCNRVYAWNVAGGSLTTVSGKGTCQADITSTGAGVAELAVAGSRIAWIVNQGGNSEKSDELYTALLPRPKERRLAAVVRTGGGEYGEPWVGGWIDGLAGSGTLLAVNHWSTAAGGVVDAARLRTITSGLRTIASGPQTLRVGSTDGTRIAVLRQDGSVALYSKSGAFLRRVQPGAPQEVALGGGYLAVLTKASTIEVYSASTGKRLFTRHPAKGAASLDVEGGLAVYAAPKPGGTQLRTVHVLRLATGRDTVLTTQARGVVAVQIEPPGVAYAVHTPGYRGAVVFVPMKRVTG
ncbi:MAG TPA: hypothetical protein VLD16_13760 [Gaiellaceae bacterium]|nr:hypothetical protein [Gaiellaceae bacterium]